ncbi:MAG TPA: hypothetical protein VIB79_08580 [Candidatus Binatia bacterium]
MHNVVQKFRNRGYATSWVTTDNVKMLGGPVFAFTIGRDRPTPDARKPLPLGKIELASPQLISSLPQNSFGAFLIVNISTRTKPSDDLPLMVNDRNVAMQHPGVVAVCSPHPRFSREGFAAS